MTQKLIAEVEFERLQGAQAWSPTAAVKEKRASQSCARYTFEDGSRLYIYFDGSASCERAASDVIAFRPGWHSCTK